LQQPGAGEYRHLCQQPQHRRLLTGPKIQLFQSLRQNEPFIRETTDDKSLQIEKIKISKVE
jgi:hypothetical protein